MGEAHISSLKTNLYKIGICDEEKLVHLESCHSSLDTILKIVEESKERNNAKGSAIKYQLNLLLEALYKCISPSDTFSIAVSFHPNIYIIVTSDHEVYTFDDVKDFDGKYKELIDEDPHLNVHYPACLTDSLLALPLIPRTEPRRIRASVTVDLFHGSSLELQYCIVDTGAPEGIYITEDVRKKNIQIYTGNIKDIRIEGHPHPLNLNGKLVIRDGDRRVVDGILGLGMITKTKFIINGTQISFESVS